MTPTIAFAGGGSGGHLFPALAIARAVEQAEPAVRCIFAGAHRGVEARLLPERGLPHRLFPFEPIHRRAWWRNARWPFLAIGLIRQLDQWLEAERPAAVIGTGGFVSGPVVWRAARRGIPTAILELDVRPGLATRLAARHAREIWVATPEAVSGLPLGARGRVVVTGAPIAPPEPERRAAARQHFGLDGDRPVVVITGGSQGSLALNRAVADWITGGGASAAQIIWATGHATHAEFAHLDQRPAVTVVPFLDPIADAWAVADLAIGRAGMNTLAELAAWGIPGILVPLPTAAANHQLHNARAAEAAGAAICLTQDHLDGATLATQVGALLADPERREAMRQAALGRAHPEASREIAARVIRLAGVAG